MHKLLIVDDLPIIVNSMESLFKENPQLQLQLYKAYSAIEALDIMSGTDVDIVLTDIRMPQMSGLEMLREIRIRYPRCKVIFLTSYGDFSYAQEAISLGGFDYILKTEREERILSAVEKAIFSLCEEVNVDRLVIKAKEQMKLTLPTLQRDFLWELLEGKRISAEQRVASFQDLALNLDPMRPVKLLIGRVDEWGRTVGASDRALLLYALQNVAEEHWETEVSTFSVLFESNKLIWLLQPKDGAYLNSFVEKLELIQHASRDLLRLPISFAVSRSSVPWEQASPAFHELQMQLCWGHGLNREALVTGDAVSGSAIANEPSSNHAKESIRLERILHLGHLIESNQRTEFFELFDEVMRSVEAESVSNLNNRAVVLHSLSSVFLTLLTRWQLPLERVQALPVSKLYEGLSMESWIDVKRYFYELALFMFDNRIRELEKHSSEVVETIHRYVDQHLDSDVSLNRLADLVQLNPSYLSRLYKQLTGSGLSEYVSELRLSTAKRLILESSLKNQEIAAALGYNSSLSFNRFFKMQTGLTPMEYRNSVLGTTSTSHSE